MLEEDKTIELIDEEANKVAGDFDGTVEQIIYIK